MVLHLSAALVLAVFVFLLVHFKATRWSHAIACTLFGYCLASTSLRPFVSLTAHTLANVLGSIRL